MLDKKIDIPLLQKSAKEVFIHVMKHLVKQGKPSVDSTSCLYRGPNGTMCAAGCLIPDDQYNELMEGCGWCVLVEANVVPYNHDRLISSLQKVHDSWHEEYIRGSFEYLNFELAEVAERYQLAFTPRS